MADESDGVEEIFEGAIRGGVVVAARIGEEIARDLERRQRTQDADARHEATQTQTRLDAERAAMRTQLGSTEQPAWWEGATAGDIASSYQLATAWRDFDGQAGSAIERIQAEVKDRYGVDLQQVQGDVFTTLSSAPDVRLSEADKVRVAEAWARTDAARDAGFDHDSWAPAYYNQDTINGRARDREDLLNAWESWRQDQKSPGPEGGRADTTGGLAAEISDLRPEAVRAAQVQDLAAAGRGKSSAAELESARETATAMLSYRADERTSEQTQQGVKDRENVMQAVDRLGDDFTPVKGYLRTAYSDAVLAGELAQLRNPESTEQLRQVLTTARERLQPAGAAGEEHSADNEKGRREADRVVRDADRQDRHAQNEVTEGRSSTSSRDTTHSPTSDRTSDRGIKTGAAEKGAGYDSPERRQQLADQLGSVSDKEAVNARLTADKGNGKHPREAVAEGPEQTSKARRGAGIDGRQQEQSKSRGR